MMEAVRIQQEDFSQDEEIGALQASSKRIGGIATFLGCARDFSQGREVTEISFDAYGSLAPPGLEKLRSGEPSQINTLDDLSSKLTASGSFSRLRGNNEYLEVP